MKNGQASLFPGFLEKQIERKFGDVEWAGDFGYRAVRNFKQRKKRKLDLGISRRKERDINQRVLEFPCDEVRVEEKFGDLSSLEDIKVLNGRKLFGINERGFKRWAAYRENLFATLSMHYACQLLARPMVIPENDRHNLVFYGLNANDLLRYLAGFGKTAGVGKEFAGYLSAWPAEIEHKNGFSKILNRSLEDFVFSMIDIGTGIVNYKEKIDTAWDYHPHMRKINGIRHEVLKRYEKDERFGVSEKRLILERGDRNPMDTRNIVFGRDGNNVLQNRLEHPGVKYAERVIAFLMSREAK